MLGERTAPDPSQRATRIGLRDGIEFTLSLLFDWIGLVQLKQANPPSVIDLGRAAHGLAVRALADQDLLARRNGLAGVPAAAAAEYLTATQTAAAVTLLWAMPFLGAGACAWGPDSGEPDPSGHRQRRLEPARNRPSSNV